MSKQLGIAILLAAAAAICVVVLACRGIRPTVRYTLPDLARGDLRREHGHIPGHDSNQGDAGALASDTHTSRKWGMADNAFVTHNRKQGRRASPRPRPAEGYGATRQTPEQEDTWPSVTVGHPCSTATSITTPAGSQPTSTIRRQRLGSGSSRLALALSSGSSLLPAIAMAIPSCRRDSTGRRLT